MADLVKQLRSDPTAIKNVKHTNTALLTDIFVTNSKLRSFISLHFFFRQYCKTQKNAPKCEERKSEVSEYVVGSNDTTLTRMKTNEECDGSMCE